MLDLLLAVASVSPAPLSEVQEVRLDLAAKTGSCTYRGEPYALEGLLRDYEMRTRSSWTDAREPGRLVRRFDALEGTLRVRESRDGERRWGEPAPWTAPLAGAAVEFARGEDADGRATFCEEQPAGSPAHELDAEVVLAGLADRSLALFAPRASRAEADVHARCSVPLEALDALLAPLGDTSGGDGTRALCVAGGLTGFTAPYLPLDLAPWLGEREGTLVARLLPDESQEPGPPVVEVEVEVDVTFAAVRAAWATALLPDGFRAEVDRYDLELALVGTAHLTFDAAGERVVRVELEAQVRTLLDALWHQDGKPIATRISHEGTLRVERRAAAH